MKATIMAVFAACLAASALDVTVSNEFWCTWGYVNPSPATVPANPTADFCSSVHDIGHAEAEADFSSVVFDVLEARPNYRFSSFPPVGFKLFFR